MKAIVCHQPGKDAHLKLEEMADPIAQARQLLITVHAIGVNRADLLQRRGLYPPPPGESEILGLEIAGVVEAVGADVSRYKVGDAVFGLVAGGGYASKCLLDERLALPVPANWTMAEAAAVAEAFFTASEALFQVGGLQSGETVLIHAGGSGVGSAAIQLAVKAGARVITTVGSEEKLTKCRQLGAAYAVNYKSEDFSQVCLQAGEGHGVALIIDFIGAAYLKTHLKILQERGRLVLVGLLGGAKAEANLALILSKRLQIFGTIMRRLTIEEKAAIRQRFETRWWPQMTAGAIRPLVFQTFALAEAEVAHQTMAAGRHFGKIILLNDDT